MSKVNRFIQFNDEAVEAKTMLLYERLARALANTTTLELTERKLLEFQLDKDMIALSVFWRHRDQEVMHLGRLSDIYLLAAGYWRHFNLQTWQAFCAEFKDHPLERFAQELFMMVEEFRVSELVMKERPGTKKAFMTRVEAYRAFHQTNVLTNHSKGLVADALLNELYILMHAGLFAETRLNWGHLQMHLVHSKLTAIYELKNSEDSYRLVSTIVHLIASDLKQDLSFQYYTYADHFTDDMTEFHYHYGMTDAEKGEDSAKETIEEAYRTWHEATEDEDAVHLQYELEHGRSGKSDSEAATEGSPDAEIEEIGYGRSEGNDNVQQQHNVEQTSKRGGLQKAGQLFGNEHINVVYEELYVDPQPNAEASKQITAWREQQKPFVRSIVEEMRKRIEMQQTERLERRLHGRLSSQLTTLFIDERPKPFYRKNAPSIQLDAVFGLLVDASASMSDKLDETKQAVLLFHDVLRELNIRHEIASYSEDAFKASREEQPNYFKIMHTYHERHQDSSARIAAFEAEEDNRDGFAIRWMAKRLATKEEQHKFLLLFSDGEPSAFGYARNGIIDTAEAVLETEKKGVSVLHLFLSTEEPAADQKDLFETMFGHKTASANNVEQFTEQTLRILRKLLHLVLQ